MHPQVQPSAATPARPLHRARLKTGHVQQQLEVASAELGLTNTVLGHSLPDSVKRSGDVQRALSQNEVIEVKVQEAADELQQVTELLDEEVTQRERLERELASRPSQ
ncbi:MAG: hypothetical protein NVS3B2_04880 [Ramlibacter sp.]